MGQQVHLQASFAGKTARADIAEISPALQMLRIHMLHHFTLVGRLFVAHFAQEPPVRGCVEMLRVQGHFVHLQRRGVEELFPALRAGVFFFFSVRVEVLSARFFRGENFVANRARDYIAMLVVFCVVV